MSDGALHSLVVFVYVQCGRQGHFGCAIRHGAMTYTVSLPLQVETQNGWFRGTGVINSALHCHRLSNLPGSRDHNVRFLCRVFTKKM